jgi:PAS domain S-box-containing protein
MAGGPAVVASGAMDSGAEPRRRRAPAGSRIPLLVLVVALGLSLVGAAALHDAVRTRAARRLDLRLLQAVDGIRRRIDSQVALLRSAAAFVDQDRPINREDFHLFVSHLELQRHFPGLQGIGYAPLVGSDQRAALVAAAREDAAPAYRIWPEPVGAGASAPVVYLEPPDARNQQVLGFDILSDPARAAAAARACASGLPSLSARLELVPASMPVVGFVLVVALPPTPGAVEPALPCGGFTQAAIRADDFLRAALDGASGARIQIHDGPPTAGALLYDTMPGLPWSERDLHVERRVELGGRHWTVMGGAPAEAASGGEAALAPGLGLLGAATSLALFLVTRSQFRARRRAEEAVAALRREEVARAHLLDEEREARRRVEATRALLDGVFEAVPAGLVVLDADLRVERVNRTLVGITGVDPDELAGAALDEVDVLDASVGALRTVQQRSAPLSAEISVGSDGGRTFLVSGAPVRATQPGAGGVVAVFVDISERKREEARIRRERDVAEVLVELGKEMNAQLDREVLIRRLAEIARAATGAATCAVRVDGDPTIGHAGEPVDDLGRVIDDDVPSPWKSRQRTTAVSRSGEVLHIHIGDREADRFDARHQAMIAGLAQQATVALENARLFEESQHLIGALARTNQALARSNRELDQFAYAASHDLKAPLRGIASLSHWIEEDLGDVGPDTRRYLELMRGRVLRLENLVDGLLRYARAGRGSGDSQVPLREVLDEVVALLAPPPSARVVMAADLPVIAGERTSLEQVFMNLIGNALKHGGRDDVTVRVDVTDDDDHWHFTVADDGVGIAADFHDRVWGMFQTLQPRDKVDSTGIGLALVRKVVEARGGRTWVESAPGQGAAFHVTWPK